MSESIVGKKSFEFAVQIVNFYKKLSVEKKEYILSKQIIRSGTSVGANVREALNAQSKMDLFATNYISKEEFEDLKNPATEILKIIRSIIITTKSKNS
ncbi:four helix bundle protein [Chryseobacterium tongliaoense]|uniref:four helix bundle protein n=1 Tax=Chryseobacterium tongliaoense TaxID=3240933 RepID=UPI003518DD55